MAGERTGGRKPEGGLTGAPRSVRKLPGELGVLEAMHFLSSDGGRNMKNSPELFVFGWEKLYLMSCNRFQILRNELENYSLLNEENLFQVFYEQLEFL